MALFTTDSWLCFHRTLTLTHTHTCTHKHFLIFACSEPTFFLLLFGRRQNVCVLSCQNRYSYVTTDETRSWKKIKITWPMTIAPKNFHGFCKKSFFFEHVEKLKMIRKWKPYLWFFSTLDPCMFFLDLPPFFCPKLRQFIFPFCGCASCKWQSWIKILLLMCPPFTLWLKS